MKSVIHLNYSFLFLFLLSNSFLYSQRNKPGYYISDVKVKKNAIVVYDSVGKEISKMPQAKNVIAGFSDTYFVVIMNNYIITYNNKCKEIGRRPVSKLKIKEVNEDSFTALRKEETRTFDKNCNEKFFNKGQFYYRFTFPYINYLGFDNSWKFFTKRAFWGLTTGVDYYYSDNSFVSFNSGATGIGNTVVSFGASSSVNGKTVSSYSSGDDTARFAYGNSAMLTNNIRVNLFSGNKIYLLLGYGLSCSVFEFSKALFQNGKEVFYKRFTTLGLAFDANIYYSKHFFIGLVALPSFYSFTNQKFEFSYLVYPKIGYRFQVKTWKRKRKNNYPNSFF